MSELYFPSSADVSLIGSSAALPHAQIHQHLQALIENHQDKASRLTGFSANQDIDYTELSELLRYNSNNVGDPYLDSTYGVNSRQMERAVLEFVAALFNVQHRDYWGYVTSGGTEANLYGLYIGRNALESSRALQAKGITPKPIAYYSSHAHYSINKAMDLLRVPSQTIEADRLGRINVEALLAAIVANGPEAHPPLIIATVGTAFTGAYDDVSAICEALKVAGVSEYYLHVDAALGGFFLTFAERVEELKGRVPSFDFRLPIHSIAVSGHKIIGTPVPCGILMTLKENLMYGRSRQIESIGSVDSTLTSSRSGFAPVCLWYALARSGVDGFVQLARQMLEAADYAFERLEAAGSRPWRNELGLSVMFDRPPEWVVSKWSLATQGEFCHVYAMQHLTHARIDGLCEDLRMVRQVFDLSANEEAEMVLDRPQFLRSVQLFSSMSSEELWKVARVARERHASRGEYLAHQGELGDELFIVVDGEIEILNVEDGNEILRSVARRGEAIGEIAVLTDLSRTASMRCTRNTHLLVIRGKDFKSIMHHHPEIASSVIEILVQKLMTH